MIKFLFDVLLGGTKDGVIPPEIQRLIDRDTALREAEWAFKLEHRRDPSPRELWAISPPDDRVLGTEAVDIYVDLHEEAHDQAEAV